MHRSGTISTEELTTHITSDGISEEEVVKLVAKYDFDGDGTVGAIADWMLSCLRLRVDPTHYHVLAFLSWQVTMQEFLQVSGFELKPKYLIKSIDDL